MEAILLAAGRGIRMNIEIPKQFFRIKSKPLFIYSLETFNKCKYIDRIFITCNFEYLDEYKFYINKYGIKNTICIEGGSTRQESVYKALSYIKTSEVLIHEAARPLIDLNFLYEIKSNFHNCDAVVPTIPVKFTIAIGNIFMEAELDRSKLHNIQLPQIFNRNILFKAHKNAIDDNYISTEDGMLVFHYGGMVKFIQGRESNIKITTKLDVEIVEKLLNMELNV